MSKLKPDVVDIVGEDKDGSFILIIAEVEPWTGDDDQLIVLSQKLKNYTSYALDGFIVKQYPEAEQKQVTVQLDHTQELPAEIKKLLSTANEVYATPTLTFISNKLS